MDTKKIGALAVAVVLLLVGTCMVVGRARSKAPAGKDITAAKKTAVTTAPKAPQHLTPVRMTQVMNGKVTSITPGDQSKGINSEIVVLNGSGNHQTFQVRPGTTMYDSKYRVIVLEELKGGTVTITYQSDEAGIKHVVTIVRK